MYCPCVCVKHVYCISGKYSILVQLWKGPADFCLATSCWMPSLQEWASTGPVAQKGGGPLALGHSQDPPGPRATSSSPEAGPLWCRGLHCATSPSPFQPNFCRCFHHPVLLVLWTELIWNTASFASEHSPEINLGRRKITSAFCRRLASYKEYVRENTLFHDVYLFRSNLI